MDASKNGSLKERLQEAADEAPLKVACGLEGCAWPGHEGTAREAREAADAHRRDAHPGLEDEIRDRRERREEETLLAARAPELRGRRWTREAAIDAIQAFERRAGHPPSNRDVSLDRDLPSQPTLAKLFGGHSAAVEAAGFPRPDRTTRYARPAREGQPSTGDETIGAGPSPGPQGGPPERARRALLLIAEGARELADALFPEPT